MYSSTLKGGECYLIPNKCKKKDNIDAELEVGTTGVADRFRLAVILFRESSYWHVLYSAVQIENTRSIRFNNSRSIPHCHNLVKWVDAMDSMVLYCCNVRVRGYQTRWLDKCVWRGLCHVFPKNGTKTSTVNNSKQQTTTKTTESVDWMDGWGHRMAYHYKRTRSKRHPWL